MSLSVNTMCYAYNSFSLITVAVNFYSLLLFTLSQTSAKPKVKLFTVKVVGFFLIVGGGWGCCVSNSKLLIPHL